MHAWLVAVPYENLVTCTLIAAYLLHQHIAVRWDVAGQQAGRWLADGLLMAPRGLFRATQQSHRFLRSQHNLLHPRRLFPHPTAEAQSECSESKGTDSHRPGCQLEVTAAVAVAVVLGDAIGTPERSVVDRRAVLLCHVRHGHTRVGGGTAGGVGGGEVAGRHCLD